MSYFNMIISLLAGLGAFMIGFKILSDNTKELSGGGLKKLFLKTGDNSFAGVGIGIATTALVQSSSVTTVIVVGFVNAGIMSLYQATAVIMGANIGTTVTAQIVALQSFDFIKYAMALTVVGIFINLFSKKERVRTVGYALAGLGLLFMGMKFMSTAMDGVKDSETIVTLLSQINNPFLLLFIGLVFTGIVQSSAAITAIIISMATAGIMIGNGGNSVLFVILGTNIGTCVTALMSSVGASVNAKRASIIHLLFNVMGSLLFFIVLIIWKDFNNIVLASLFPLAGTQIAMFHTLFNVLCTLLFLPFVKLFVFLSKKILPDSAKREQGVSQFLDERLLITPAIAMAQVDKEVVETARKAMNILNFSVDGFLQKDKNLREKVNRCMDDLKKIGEEIDAYMIKVSVKETEYDMELKISAYHHIITDLLRISEIAENIAKYTKTAIEKDLSFSDAVVVDIKTMVWNLQNLFDLAVEFLSGQNLKVLTELDNIEDNVDAAKKRLIDDHIARLNSGECKPASSSVFINLVSNLERVGDHIYLIAHALQAERR